MSDEQPTSTGADAPVGAAPMPAAPASSDDYFNSSRLRVIGLITAGVVAVGVLGGLAGIAFDDDPIDSTKVVQPGTGSALGSPGSSVGLRAPSAGLLRADGTSPSPIGSATPDDATPSPEDSPTPTDPPPDGGGGVTLDNGVQIYVPPGWQVDRQDGAQVNLSDGQGNWAFAYSAGTVDTAGEASNLITSNKDGLLPPEFYTQLQTSEIGTIPPIGSLVSIAYMDYQTIWTDGQAAVSLYGQIYAGIRQDGTPLIVLVEHTPAEDWDAGFEQVRGLVDATFVDFAGLG